MGLFDKKKLNFDEYMEYVKENNLNHGIVRGKKIYARNEKEVLAKLGLTLSDKGYLRNVRFTGEGYYDCLKLNKIKSVEKIDEIVKKYNQFKSQRQLERFKKVRVSDSKQKKKEEAKTLSGYVKGKTFEKGYLLQDVADHLDLNRQTFYNKLRRNSLSAVELIKIVDFLSLSVTEIKRKFK